MCTSLWPPAMIEFASYSKGSMLLRAIEWSQPAALASFHNPSGVSRDNQPLTLRHLLAKRNRLT
ncbi:MAG: hypothetical protein CMJ75_21230 [Planctomycetaceae bacterium]|nr:hypothetical protein [Planctomycetaceae bacterium]